MTIFAASDGRVAERLGRGLQNLVQRFESARDLTLLIIIRKLNMMKRILPFIIILAVFTSSCVSKKKFNELEAEKNELEAQVSSLEGSVADLKSQVDDLSQSNSELEKEKNALDDNLSSVMTKLEAQEKDVAAMKENLEQKQYQLNQMWTEMESAFSSVETAASETEARVKQLESFLYLDFNEGFTFNSGSTRILNDNKETLDKIAEMLMRNTNVTMVVEGHADKRGMIEGAAYRDNLELSIARANSVVRALISKGVDPAQLIVSGRGEHAPVVDGSSSAELEPNRRAEFIVVPNVGKIYKVYSEKKGDK